MLVRKEHLSERLKAIQASSWLFDGLDVLGLRDRRTKAVRSLKGPNELHIMGERVLPWKIIKSFDTSTGCLKDLAVVVKLLKGIL